MRGGQGLARGAWLVAWAFGAGLIACGPVELSESTPGGGGRGGKSGPGEGCFADADCEAGTFGCVDNVCLGCQSDLDCPQPGAAGCSASCSEGACVVGCGSCTTDADCAAALCVVGTCRPTCEAVTCELDCPAGFDVDPRGCAICACAPCRTGADCPTSGPGCTASCLGGACSESCGGGCERDLDCGGGQQCVAGACAAICGSDADCGPGGSCVRGTCERPVCSCPEIFDPVCGLDGATWPNACVADCAGVGVDHAGACGGSTCTTHGECGPGRHCEGGSCVAGSCSCTVGGFPVCGDDGFSTFSSACEAACADAGVDREGRCETSCASTRDCGSTRVCAFGNCSDPIASGSCERIFEPYCGTDGVSYLNFCLLEQARIGFSFDGGCFGDCSSNDDCSFFERCDRGTCAPCTPGDVTEVCTSQSGTTMAFAASCRGEATLSYGLGCLFCRTNAECPGGACDEALGICSFVGVP